MTDASIHSPPFFLQLDPILSTVVAFSPSGDHLQFGEAAAYFDARLQSLAYCVLVCYHWLTGSGVQTYGEQSLV